MAHTLTKPQQRLLRNLLKVGRWNNESEIIRYGLHLVAREVEAEHARGLEPYPASTLMSAYGRLTLSDRRDEKSMEMASAGPAPEELA